MTRPIVISTRYDGRAADAGLNETASTASRAGSRLRSLRNGAIVAGAGAVLLGKRLKDSASDAEQSVGATQSVFGKYADTVIKRSRDAARSVGISANEYRELSNVTGSMLKSAGTPLRKVTKLTHDLNTRAADMAATFGGTTREAVEAVSSLLRGEADPIERYGVSIKQSDVNARLAAKGLDNLTGSALKQAESQARLGLLYEQTAAVKGQYARESAQMAGQEQRFKAQTADLSATLGKALLPAMAGVLGVVNDFLPTVQDLAERHAPRLGSQIADLTGKIGPLASAGLDKVTGQIDRLRQGGAGADLSSIGDSLAKLRPVVTDALSALPGLGDTLSVTSTVMAFAADNTDLLAKALPVLAAGYVAVKAAGVAANLVQVASVPTKIAEVVVNRQLVASNKALIASRAGVTATTAASTVAETANTGARSRSVVGIIAQRVALVATSAATKAAAIAQIALNVAMTANPIGLIIVAIAALVAGLVFAYKRSTTFRNIVQGAFRGVITAGRALVSAVKPHLTTIGAAAAVLGKVFTLQFRLAGAALRLLIGAGRAAVSGIRTAFTGGIAFVKGIPGKIKSAFSGAPGLLLGIGSDIVAGLVSGIRNGANRVIAAARSLADNIPGPIRRALGIASPSKVARGLGRWVSRGLALGILDGGSNVDRAVVRLGKLINKRLPKLADDATKKQRQAARRAERRHLQEIRRQIRTVGAVVLKEGRANLAALVKQRREYANAVTQAARDFAGLASIKPGENESLTAATISQGLRDRLAAITNFNKKLETLRKAKISKGLYNQIVQMGVEEGTAYAEALVAGGPKAVAEANALQKRIDAASKSLGSNTANTMYKAGIDTAQGYIRGLQSMIRKVNSSGLKVARGLVKALKKALGIRSPSRVFRGIGGDTMAGLTLGLDASRAVRQGRLIADGLTRGYGSPALTADLIASGVARRSGAGPSVVNQYNLTVKGDARMTRAEWGALLDKAIREAKRSGLVPA